MWSFTISLSLAFLLLAPNVFATYACRKGRWASEPGIAIDLRFMRDKSRDKVGQDQCTPGVYYVPWNPSAPHKITAQTRIPEDWKMQRRGTEGGIRFTCDHLVELQQVKSVLEKPGGACDKALVFAQQDGNNANMALQKLSTIRDHTWQHRNLYNVEYDAEIRKGNSVSNGLSTIRGYAWPTINEIHSHVVEHHGDDAFATADAIDAEILIQFPDASMALPTVRSVWTTYSGLIVTKWRTEMAVARAARDKAVAAECKAAEGKEAAGGGGSGGGGGAGGATGGVATRRRTPTLPARMLRRHRSRLAAPEATTSTSPLYSAGFSSLVARARKRAARSGPHAPPARSCPVGKNQKRIIPRKQVKTAPRPTTKPRKPAQRPAPRPANAKKKIAKRPASRARREVGKPLVKKRTTPKRKPKVVPKSTRRPRGKPRQRRSRR